MNVIQRVNNAGSPCTASACTGTSPAHDRVVVLPAIAVELTDEQYQRAVRALARIMATWWEHHAPTPLTATATRSRRPQ